MENFADRLIRFYKQLQPPQNLPNGVEVLFPLKQPEVMQVMTSFYKKYFDDIHPRRMMLGINPGRLGAGITGINFTAPLQLKEACGINHPFGLSTELSAEFIYAVMKHYGGVRTFYSHWFIGAVCPLGFIKDGKNINYYDDAGLQKRVTPFILTSLQQQLAMGFKTDYCICVGGEKNYKFLSALNETHRWFQKIIPLPHPRFILQYRRRQMDRYIDQYVEVLRFAG